jgi:hypothetical protein
MRRLCFIRRGCCVVKEENEALWMRGYFGGVSKRHPEQTWTTPKTPDHLLMYMYLIIHDIPIIMPHPCTCITINDDKEDDSPRMDQACMVLACPYMALTCPTGEIIPSQATTSAIPPGSQLALRSMLSSKRRLS